jgi:hypothetical protein
VARPAARNDVERWFLGRGIPHFIEGYSAREDILTRVAPFLAVVFVGEVFVTFGDRYEGWLQAVAFIVTLAALLGAVALVNRLRGRPLTSLPDDIGALELALFVLGPPLAALATDSRSVQEVLALTGVNVVVLGLAYLATSYGLVPMVRWGVGLIRRQLDHLAAIIVRTLPFLLLFSVFFVLTTEVWQVADDLPGAYFGLIVGGMVVLGSLFVVIVTRADIDELNRFTSWNEIRELCDGARVDVGSTRDLEEPPTVLPLPRRARLNVAMVMCVGQAVQIAIVSLSVFAFYTLFGLLAIREQTLASWLGAEAVDGTDRIATFGFFGDDVVLSRQLLYVAAFVATFAGLQFAVQVVTDADYRRQFANDMAVDVRQALAVRRAVAIRDDPQRVLQSPRRRAAPR